MLSNLTIGIVAGIGFGGWVYSKTIRSSGGNAKNALVAATVAGLICTIIIATALGFIFR